MDNQKQFKVRDARKKDKFQIDDIYLNGYARLCGIYATGVYCSLCRHANFNTQECWPNIQTIADELDISKPSAIKGIQALEEWGIIKIIKEKDEKTKRQLNNVYVLLDKSEWKPKPNSRVNVINSDNQQSRVNDIDPARVNEIDPEPSQPQEKSRVNDIDCNVTKNAKDSKEIQISNASVAESVKLNDLIELFKPVNPSYDRLFGNVTQREALERLLKKHGAEKITKVIKALEFSQGRMFAPDITTPKQLEDKLGSLNAFFKREKERIESEKNKKQKPFYRGMPMRQMYGKWQVLDRGDWKEYADSESLIEFK